MSRSLFLVAEVYLSASSVIQRVRPTCDVIYCVRQFRKTVLGSFASANLNIGVPNRRTFTSYNVWLLGLKTSGAVLCNVAVRVISCSGGI